MKCPHCGKETEEEEGPLPLDQGFTDFRRVYPKRRGGQRWPQARLNYISLVRSGVDPEVLYDKAVAYAFFCQRVHTACEFVMQAATFLGRGGGWEETWSVETVFDQARRQLQEQT